MNDTFDLRELLADELIQRHESGYDVDRVAAEINDALGDPDGAATEADIGRLYDALDDTRLRAGWPFQEPTELGEIVGWLPEIPAQPRPDQAAYADRVHGAWLGRCAGCNLGKPVEAYGWNRDKVHRYLELADAFPLTDYIPVLSPMPEQFTLNPSWEVAARGRVNAMARDDDTDYTMLGLHVLEKYGADFTSADVGREWLRLLPYGAVFTAERVAYRNLINQLDPPASATFRNPYREWIGALIRGDIFGYASPGDPFTAARLAYQDAALSHTGNGIYGEMWAAALVAAAFSSSSASEALDVALVVVPGRSRLSAALREMLALYRLGTSWEEAMAWVDEHLGAYHWVHTINNAAVVTAALLWGEGDFSRTIGLAVEAGLDTDCTGATAGSVFGAIHGTAALPPHWTVPLNDTIHSAIFGFDGLPISALVERTVRLENSFADRRGRA